MSVINLRQISSGRTRVITNTTTQEEREVWSRIYNRELKLYRKEKKSFFDRLKRKFTKWRD